MMIPTIPTPEELLDKGFSRGKKQADLIRSQKIPKHLKGKRIEERRVVTSCQVIKDKLKSTNENEKSFICGFKDDKSFKYNVKESEKEKECRKMEEEEKVDKKESIQTDSKDSKVEKMEELLKQKGKSKYWLFNKFETMSYTNFDNMIKNRTQSIKYENIEKLCHFLECTPNDLFTKKQ